VDLASDGMGLHVRVQPSFGVPRSSVALILVTDGEERATLAAVRSLGASGHAVLVTSSVGKSLAGASRFCSDELDVPDPLRDPGRFCDRLRSIFVVRKPDILIPMTEAALRAVLPRRNEFAPVQIPFASIDGFREVSDKARVLERARQLGIPEPTLESVGSTEELLRQGSALLQQSPLVLKPARSVATGPAGQIKTSVQYAHRPDELEAIAASLDDRAFPILLQRRVEGPGIGVFLLVWDGKLIARFAHRRIREKPPSGGVSVLRESIELPEGLEAASLALLRSFGWTGVAMVEYKQDRASGEYYLMEVNGRFWGSLQLAIDAGVDFPALLVSAALGESPSPHLDYQVGVQTRWLLGDFDHLLARLTRSRTSLGLDEGGPSRGRACWDFLRGFFPHVRNEVFRVRDPGPAGRELVQWLREASGLQRRDR
jgi:predicted ATP-grasp superfamily ATP-dependent carboligase